MKKKTKPVAKPVIKKEEAIVKRETVATMGIVDGRLTGHSVRMLTIDLEGKRSVSIGKAEDGDFYITYMRPSTSYEKIHPEWKPQIFNLIENSDYHTSSFILSPEAAAATRDLLDRLLKG